MISLRDILTTFVYERIEGKMFKTDKRNYLKKFIENHPDLNDIEKQVIQNSIVNLGRPKVWQDKELTHLAKSFQKLSLDSKLSDDGKVLLKQLHKSDWFFGILYNLKFFGN
jgi:hypothetical protein